MDALFEYGWTALHTAVLMGHTAVARQLLAAGADVHVRADGGETVLHWAASMGNVDGPGPPGTVERPSRFPQ